MTRTQLVDALKMLEGMQSSEPPSTVVRRFDGITITVVSTGTCIERMSVSKGSMGKALDEMNAYMREIVKAVGRQRALLALLPAAPHEA